MAAEKILVTAIDFGTTFSGWAFSFRHDYESNPTKIYTKPWNSGKEISPKSPTTVLIRPDGKTLEAFGYEAEDKYADLAANDEHRNWYYFRRFKMALYDDEAGIQDDHLIIALEPEAASIYCRHIPLKTMTSDGKTAIVPLTEGTRYIVIDAGGGTIDITIHEVMGNGHLKELHKATGGAWGGQEVDDSFKQFLIDIFGAPVFEEFIKDEMEDYLDLFREFEVKKRKVFPDCEGSCIIRLPLTLVEIFEKTTQKKLQTAIAQTHFASKLELTKGNKLKIDNSLMRVLFYEAVKDAADHVKTFHGVKNKYNISIALLVGGFSESPMLVSAVKNSCLLWNVVVPDEASLVVLKGAVLFGHDPSAITYRVCRYTYGTHGLQRFEDEVHPTECLATSSDGRRYCTNILYPFIKEGTLFKDGDIVDNFENRPFEDDDDFIDVTIYASTDKDVEYTDDKCCTLVGNLTVDQLDMNKSRTERNCRIQIFLGNTELHVESIDVNTGRRLKASFDFLD